MFRWTGGSGSCPPPLLISLQQIPIQISPKTLSQISPKTLSQISPKTVSQISPPIQISSQLRPSATTALEPTGEIP